MSSSVPNPSSTPADATTNRPLRRAGGPGGGAGARRFRFGLQSLVVFLSVTASCIFLGLVASRAGVRYDATASREHLLSARTRAVLGGLDGPYEIIIAADTSNLDRRALQHARDVLDSFARTSDKVAVSFIDTSSARGVSDYDALLRRLADRFRAEIDAQRGVVNASVEAARLQADSLGLLAAQIVAAKDAVPAGDPNAEALRRLLDDYAARARVAALTLEQGVTEAGDALKERVGPLDVPPIDLAARRIAQKLVGVNTDLARLLRELRLVDQARDVPQTLKNQMRPVPGSLQSQLEVLRAAADSIDRLPPLAILSVARTLEQTSAALVIGPPRTAPASGSTPAPASTVGDRITAIDFSSLFPPALPEGAAASVSIDQRARVEELTATAVASLSSAQTPIVVLVHDQPSRLAPRFEPFAALADRLHLRGMDLVEWAAALDADPPSLAPLSGDRNRPVVYVAQTTSPNTPEAAERMKRMAAALSRLVADGKNVMLSVNVSTLPGIGVTDPLVDFLPALGVTADSGRPLMRREQGRTGPVVITDFLPSTTVGDHPIAEALNGLTTHFFWPVSIRPAPPAPPAAAPPTKSTTPAAGPFTITPIIQIDSDLAVWGESEWLGYSRIPAAQRRSVIDPPSPDSGRDDAQGPWPIVVACRRPIPGEQHDQRLVVVGCSGWFLDDVTQQQVGVIDGRPVFVAPGNLELFEAGTYWLAHQDDLISRSPTAQAVPVIRPLTANQVQAVRWSLFAGLPALVLLVGVMWRLIRH